MTTITSIFPQHRSGNPLRPFQLVTPELFGIGPGFPNSPSEANRVELQKTVNFVSILNHVCKSIRTLDSIPGEEVRPLTLGGGIVRDLILGGQPNDIDIWLPSNGHIQDANEMMRLISAIFNVPVQLIFSLNAQEGAEAENYRDVSNRWVLEFVVDGFRFNVMRTMVAWTSPQSFYDRLMQNFDLDICMFFVAFHTNINTDVHQWRKHVIMPQHLVEDLRNGLQVNFLTWNRWRMDQTSPERKRLRLEKMNARYEFDEGDAGAIDMEDLVATPVKLSWLLTKLHLMPLPKVPERETMEVLAEEDDPNVAPLPTPTQVTARPQIPTIEADPRFAGLTCAARQAYVSQFLQARFNAQGHRPLSWS